jgi:hypothetical protein
MMPNAARYESLESGVLGGRAHSRWLSAAFSVTHDSLTAGHHLGHARLSRALDSNESTGVQHSISASLGYGLN